jgi:surface protein
MSSKWGKLTFFIFFSSSFTAAPLPPPIEITVIATKGRRFNTLSSCRVSSSGNGFTWLLVALPLILLVLAAGFNMMLFQEKASFVIATAAGNESMCMVAADGNATRVAAHSVVAGTRTSVLNIKIVNARARARMKDIDADVVLAAGGQHAQKVHVPFSKIRARTPTTILPVKLSVLMREHVFFNVDVNTTRVATHIVTGSINVPSNNIVNARVKDGDSEVVLADGQHAQKVPFSKIRARTAATILPVKIRALMRVHVYTYEFLHLDGNTTRVATHIVTGDIVANARARVKDGDSSVVFGENAQNVPFCWKSHVHTPALLLPVQMLIQVFVHIPPSVTVGIAGFLVLGLYVFSGVIPGWMLCLFGYRVGLGKNKQRAWFPRFYISLLVSLFGVVGVVQAVAIPDCTYSPTTWQSFVSPTGSYRSSGSDCGIRQAVDAYITSGTTGSYGPIEDWDTSLVTDMSYLFHSVYDRDRAAPEEKKSSFNADISKWITGAVTTMKQSKCTLSIPLSLWPAFRCCVF